MKEQLKNILSDSKIDEFLSNGRIKSINTSDYFIRAGEVPNRFGYVVSVLFRYVYLNDRIDKYRRTHYLRNPLNLTCTNLFRTITVKNLDK